jgi:hypothetical protein
MNVTGWMTGVVAVMVLSGCATSSKAGTPESNGASPPGRVAEVSAEPIEVNVLTKWEDDPGNPAFPGDAGAAAQETFLEQLRRHGVMPMETAPSGLDNVDVLLTVKVGRLGNAVVINTSMVGPREGQVLGRQSRTLDQGKPIAPLLADLAKGLAQTLRDWKQAPRP